MIRLLVALALVSGLTGRGDAAPPSSFDQRAAAIRSEVRVDPKRALAHAEALRAAPHDSPDHRVHDDATADWLRAEALITLNRPAEALVVVRNALAELGETEGEAAIRGELILARAGAAKALNRVEDALRDNQHAYRLFGRAKDARGQAIALHYIGSLYLDGGDYATALRYFDQSIDGFSSDPSLSLSTQNNRAVAFSQLGRFREAVSAYQAALTYVHGDAATRSLILRNLARAQAEAGDFAAAQTSLSRAFLIARTDTAADDRPALYGVAAFLALRQRDLPRAESLVRRGLVDAANSDPVTQR